MTFMEIAGQWLGKIVVALITLFVGFIIAKLAGLLTKRVLHEAEINRVLATAGMKLDETIGRLVEYLLYVITLLIILNQFGLTKLVLGILITLAIALIAFSLLLAIKDFVPNAITGLFIRKKLKSHLGKKVKIGMVTGKLVHVGVVQSVVKDGVEHRVPHLYTSKENITKIRAS